MKEIKQHDPYTIKVVAISYSLAIFLFNVPDWEHALEEVFLVGTMAAFLLLIIGSHGD